MTLIQLSAPLTVTDGGLETTLVFLEHLGLPCFAAFPLLMQLYISLTDWAPLTGIGWWDAWELWNGFANYSDLVHDDRLWSALGRTGLVMLVCVEACSSRSGAICRAIFNTPMSCTMSASTPASAIAPMTRAASASSCSKTSVLNVRYPRTPRRCSVRMASGSSLRSNPTFARALKCLSPK